VELFEDERVCIRRCPAARVSPQNGYPSQRLPGFYNESNQLSRQLVHIGVHDNLLGICASGTVHHHIYRPVYQPELIRLTCIHSWYMSTTTRHTRLVLGKPSKVSTFHLSDKGLGCLKSGPYTHTSFAAQFPQRRLLTVV